MFVGIIIGFVAGFITGILVGRNNKARVEKLVAEAQAEIARLKGNK